MNIEYIGTRQIKPYAGNAKKHDETQIENVAKSIQQFGFAQPLVIDQNSELVIGHCRLAAAKKLGIPEVPCVRLEGLTEEQVKKLRLIDNKLNESEWDTKTLLADMRGLDLSDFNIGNRADGTYDDAPPVSVLSAVAGSWQNRKRYWIELIGDSGEGRDENLLGEGLHKLVKKLGTNLTGTSIFDPVLCELLYTWLSKPGDSIFDPFAGGSVRGIVAEQLGRHYTGIDLRQEQIDANNASAAQLFLSPRYICDDSLNADNHIEDNTADMIMSCPPYADLEQYSDDPRDISNMDYEDFCKVYKEIIAIACRKLKPNSFAAWTVSDVRDKNGLYRGFPTFTKRCFEQAGLKTVAELILRNQLVTAGLRANGCFMSNLKTVRTHQNVLIFYKGDEQPTHNITVTEESVDHIKGDSK